MNASSLATVFQWRDQHRSLLTLFWFFIISFCLHALALYIFQVTYPSALSIAPPPVQVSLLTPTTPEYRTLIRWIEAGNPATAIFPPDITPPGLLQSTYKPSFMTVRALPEQADEMYEPIRFRPAFDTSDVLANAMNNRPRTDNALHFSPGTSSLRLSGQLAGRIKKQDETLPPPLKSSIPLKPSRFMAGVSDRGEVRYLFLEESSGDIEIDRWAERHLKQIIFSQAPQSITWGVATYFWGDDTCKPAH